MTHTHTTYHEAVHAALHLLADDMATRFPPTRTSRRSAHTCAPS